MLACQARLASANPRTHYANDFLPSERRLQLQNSTKGDAGFSNQGGAFHFGSFIRVKPRKTAGYLSASKSASILASPVGPPLTFPLRLSLCDKAAGPMTGRFSGADHLSRPLFFTVIATLRCIQRMAIKFLRSLRDR
jgi:hypothetical protein